MNSFHGTGISLFQLSSNSSGDENPTAISLRDCRQRNLQLPDDTVAHAKASVDVPEPPNSIQHISGHLEGVKKTGEVLARKL